jgi:hypothetical protein
MLCGTRAEGPATAPFFNPSTKCCTYVPVLPNFLVGRMLGDDGPAFAHGRATVEARLARPLIVTPLGIGRTPTDDRRYRTRAPSSFGRDRSMRCPHYLDEGGQCGIWRHRAAVCATWYCKHVRGAVGQRFWRTLHGLLSAVERDLSAWCARELCGPTAATHDAGRRRFGEWSGREREFFIECARLVDALRWDDIARICGPEMAPLLSRTRAAFDELRSQAIPGRLRTGAYTVIGSHRGASIVEGYDGGDRLALPDAVLEALPYFDGSAPTPDVLQTIRAATGLAMERDLVRLLVDFEILIPTSRE